jgi:hypothetical protein
MPEISFLTPRLEKQKSHKVAPTASINEKAMGLYGHPWLPIPSSGSDLRVTLPKIRIVIKKVKVKHSHSLPHLGNHYNSERADLSRRIWGRIWGRRSYFMFS